MSATDPQIKLRLPDKVRSQLKQLAQARHRSMNAQILTMLESGIAAEKMAPGQP